MLGRYRESVRAWSDPVGRALFRLHLRPNHLTMCGLLVSACAGAAFVFGHVRLAGVLLILAGLFDLFDGSLARASEKYMPHGLRRKRKGWSDARRLKWLHTPA